MAARLRILDNGVLRDITRLRIKQAGVLRTIKTLKVMDGGVLRTVGIFATPLSPTASPSSVITTTFTSEATTSSVTVTPGGGLGPYTYAWIRISGSGTALSPSSATTAFFASAPAGSGFVTGTFRCTVTDSLGQTGTVDVGAAFNFEDLS